MRRENPGPSRLPCYLQSLRWRGAHRTGPRDGSVKWVWLGRVWRGETNGWVSRCSLWKDGQRDVVGRQLGESCKKVEWEPLPGPPWGVLRVGRGAAMVLWVSGGNIFMMSEPLYLIPFFSQPLRLPLAHRKEGQWCGRELVA